MIKELIKLANHLDSKKLTKEADFLDKIIIKLSFIPSVSGFKEGFSEWKSNPNWGKYPFSKVKDEIDPNFFYLFKVYGSFPEFDNLSGTPSEEDISSVRQTYMQYTGLAGDDISEDLILKTKNLAATLEVEENKRFKEERKRIKNICDLDQAAKRDNVIEYTYITKGGVEIKAYSSSHNNANEASTHYPNPSKDDSSKMIGYYVPSYRVWYSLSGWECFAKDGEESNTKDQNWDFGEMKLILNSNEIKDIENIFAPLGKANTIVNLLKWTSNDYERSKETSTQGWTPEIIEPLFKG